MQDECRIKIRKPSTTVGEAVELAHKLLRLSNVPINAAPSSEDPFITGKNATGLSSDLKNAKTRTEKLHSVETMTVNRHLELMYEFKERYAEVSV